MGKEIIYKTAELSECEKIVLGCIYEHHRKKQEAPNLKDIMSMLEGNYGIIWKLQTICTFFTWMEKKGLISVKKNGRYSYYYPVLPFESYVKQELEQLCKIYFEGNVKMLKKFVRQL